MGGCRAEVRYWWTKCQDTIEHITMHSGHILEPSMNEFESPQPKHTAHTHTHIYYVYRRSVAIHLVSVGLAQAYPN